MRKLLLAALMILPSCGVVKGCTKSPLVDEMIKEANEAYVEDNVYEELLEDVIEATTGLEIDFSIDTEEDEDGLVVN